MAITPNPGQSRNQIGNTRRIGKSTLYGVRESNRNAEIVQYHVSLFPELVL